MVKIIDLKFQQQPGAIAAFLVETAAGPALVETGPHSTLSVLSEALGQHGHKLSDIKHVFITHIHLDHAGAAWVFAAHGATIYLHPQGLPHLNNPEKLMSSAKRIYMEDMDRLWGEMKPIATSQLCAVDHKQKVMVGKTGFKAMHTPGHAVHHIAWEIGNIAFTGDVAGVKIGKDGPALPPCPPPDINIENWVQSLHLLRSRRYEAIYLTHFGEVKQPKNHFIELEGRLLNWANWIKPFWENGSAQEAVVPLFKEYVDKQLQFLRIGEADMQRYELANPAEKSVAGLYRYWTKKGS